MTWIDFSWTLAIAACLTLASIHAQIAVRLAGRSRYAHLSFTLSAVAVAITGFIELSALRAETVEAYRSAMFHAQIPLWLMLVSLASFIWFFFEGGRRWMPAASVTISTVCIAANIMVPVEWQVRYAESIRQVATFGGVFFTFGQLKSGPVTIIDMAGAVMLLVFVMDSSVRAWRNGSRRHAVMVGGGIVFFLLVSRTYAALVELGVVETPFFFVFPYLALLVAMGHELSVEVFQRARLAEEIKERERQIELAARAAMLGFWRWDIKTGDLWASHGARVIFGVAEDQPITFAVFEEKVHPSDLELVRHHIEQAMRTRQEYEAEYRIQAGADRWRWIAARGRVEPATDGAPSRMRGVVIDITERKSAQLDAEAIRHELAHVSRASILGELAGSLAHEINQPLTAILSNAQAARHMLSGGSADPTEIRDIIEDIINDDKRASEVIQRLRALVQKKERINPERINLDEVVREVARLLNGEVLERRVQFAIEAGPEQSPVFAGRVEVQQILINLIVNGMDAVRDQPVERRRVTVRTRAVAGGSAIEVADTGAGIPPAILGDIFRPFFTTKPNGLGMGLAVSRYLVEAHGGTLSAANQPDGGAVFTMVLPAAEEGSSA